MERDQLDEIMGEIYEQCITIMKKKNHDYGGGDLFGNLRDFGWPGVVVRMGDKYHRLKNFVKCNRLEVEDESVDDTLSDLLNYTMLAIAMRKRGIDGKAR